MANRFSDLYMDQAFHIWYESNRPGMKKLQELLPDDGEQGKPHEITLNNWKKELGWEERADALSGQASALLDQEVIQRRVLMWEKLEKTGEALIDKGKKYIEEHELKDSGDAIRAIVEGAEMLRASVGQAQAWANIGKMTTDQINREIMKLVGKSGEIDLTDGEEITGNDEPIEGELSEI